jgi:hypothetical protein
LSSLLPFYKVKFMRAKECSRLNNIQIMRVGQTLFMSVLLKSVMLGSVHPTKDKTSLSKRTGGDKTLSLRSVGSAHRFNKTLPKPYRVDAAHATKRQSRVVVIFLTISPCGKSRRRRL